MSEEFRTALRRARIETQRRQQLREAERNRIIRAAIMMVTAYIFCAIPWTYLSIAYDWRYAWVIVPMVILGALTIKDLKKGGKEHGGTV